MGQLLLNELFVALTLVLEVSLRQNAPAAKLAVDVGLARFYSSVVAIAGLAASAIPLWILAWTNAPFTSRAEELGAFLGSSSICRTIR